MADDRQNSVLHRAGIVPVSQASDPLPSATAGTWVDKYGVLRHKAADSTSRAMGLEGAVPSSRVAFSVNPTALDTLGIGSATIQFVSSLGSAGSNVQVLIGTDAAHTLASLVKAINGTSAPAEWVEATTPLAASLLADAVTATSLRVRLADARGGAVVAGTLATTALTASISGGASAWTNADLSAYGAKPQQLKEAMCAVTITSAMITAGHLWLEMPFTPTEWVAQAYSSAGVQRAYSDVTAISGNAIHVTLGGGSSPNLQANDVLTVRAAG